MAALAATFALALALAGGPGGDAGVDAQWQVRGCQHGHGYKPASRGLGTALRHHQPLTRRHGRRAWHFVLCTTSRDDTVRLKGERRNWLEWRRSWPHLYRIRYNRFPVWVHGWLRSIAACESHGSPTAIGGGGAYRGRYQFSFSTWAVVGGAGDPAAAHPWEQDYRAAVLLTRYGSQHWPVCS